MSCVEKLLAAKGCTVHTITPESTVLAAAKLMNDHRIGSLVVVNDREQVVGMFTERDILTRVVAAGRPPSTTAVRDVMTARVLTCAPETNLDQVRHSMRTHRIRHVPVINDGKLAGMVSIGDLNTAEVKVLSETIEYLEQYSVRT